MQEKKWEYEKSEFFPKRNYLPILLEFVINHEVPLYFLFLVKSVKIAS